MSRLTLRSVTVTTPARTCLTSSETSVRTSPSSPVAVVVVVVVVAAVVEVTVVLAGAVDEPVAGGSEVTRTQEEVRTAQQGEHGDPVIHREDSTKGTGWETLRYGSPLAHRR